MPSLSEIAAFQNAVLGGIPKGDEAFSQISNIGQIYRTAQELEKSRFELNQAKENTNLNLLTSTYQNPVWNTRDPQQVLEVIRSQRAQAAARGIAIKPGSPLDQVEGLVAQSILNQDPRFMEQAYNALRDNINLFGGERARQIQPTLTTSGDNPAQASIGGIGSAGGVTLQQPQYNPPLPGQPQPQTQPLITPQPGAPAAAPTPTPTPAPAQAPLQFGGIQLPYAPRLQGDIRPFAPNEKADLQRGEQQRTAANQTRETVGRLRFDLESGINTASRIAKGRFFLTGAAGAAEEAFQREVQQNTDYAQFTKDLARININLNGGADSQYANTDAGKQMLAIAGGQGAPINVAQKILLTNLGQAAQMDLTSRMIQNVGNTNPANLPHLINNFNQIGSDFRAFQLIGVYTSNLSDAEKRNASKIILKGADEKTANALINSSYRLMDLSGVRYNK